MLIAPDVRSAPVTSVRMSTRYLRNSRPRCASRLVGVAATGRAWPDIVRYRTRCGPVNANDRGAQGPCRHPLVIPKSPPAGRGTAAWRIIAYYLPVTGIQFDPKPP